MAYEPDEVNDWGAIATRGFCYKGEGYAPGQWWYGPKDDFEQLMLMGFFGQARPRWLVERLMGRARLADAQAEFWNNSYLSPGLTGAQATAAYGEFILRFIERELRLSNAAWNWDKVFATQYHVVN